MKNFIALFVAALIVGFACFAVAYWLFSVDKKEAENIGLAVFVSGFVVELFKPAIASFFKRF